MYEIESLEQRLESAAWHISSRSGTNGQCVEVALLAGPAGDQDADDEAIPACTVPFDERSGCGVDVESVGHGNDTTFVGLTFRTFTGKCGGHDLTLLQAQQLRDQLTTATT